jgi:hypothetical protein
MKHTTSRELYGYWDRLRAGRSAPERSDLDPGAVRTLLGDILLLEFNGRERHLVRLAGTRVCTLLGRELKGSALTDCFAPEDRHDLTAMLDNVAAAAQPAISGIRGETLDGRSLNLEFVTLPLRHRGRTHARLLGALTALETPYWAGVSPLARLRLVTSRQLYRTEGPGGTEIDLVTPPPRVVTGRLRLLNGGRA